MGMDYAGLVVENTDNGLVLSQVECLKADRGLLKSKCFRSLKRRHNLSSR